MPSSYRAQTLASDERHKRDQTSPVPLGEQTQHANKLNTLFLPFQSKNLR
ncbi:hypothetical protein RB834 [Rhodopirellula baltica SH 1]|uniref:Uncharacterized protein n=1 Tax=Rhodopirellula baltica (strain DSM 10527 / NCIMB 13988 / SH1) TaxID=243090 RepID=Q7UY72_RHOBA|nr:hypothetical protein RB834 [Rhodopirellula baltica SH 1]